MCVFGEILISVQVSWLIIEEMRQSNDGERKGTEVMDKHYFENILSGSKMLITSSRLSRTERR